MPLSTTFSRVFILPVAALFVLAVITACSSSDEVEDQANDQMADDAGVDTGDLDTADPDPPQDNPTICTAGESRCDGPDSVEVCADDELAWEHSLCPSGQRCDASSGICSEQVCTPGQFDGCTDDGTTRHCNESGTGFGHTSCPENQNCAGDGCPVTECQQGTVRCAARDLLETCSEAGVYAPSGICPTGTECFDGQCEELCEISTKVSSYIGCEYWSIDLDNFQEALSEPHAIIITNHNDGLSAEVDFFEGHTDRRIMQGADGQSFDTTIPPGQARVFLIPTGFGHSGTRTFSNQAIRVTSSIPVVAHQFNPLNNVGVFSNDGTVLLPTNSVGTEYWGLSWYNRDDSVKLRGYITLVNSSTAPNEVRVRPSAQVVAGPEIPTIEAGEERTFELEPGESLNLVASGTELSDAEISGCLSDPEGNPDHVNPCPDLSGTHIEANLPITVFGGHQCANVLLGIDRCDHIESILLPVDAWGTNYVGTKFSPRATGSRVEPDIWRVIAAHDDTRLQTDPPISGIHDTFLDAGEWRQFASRQDFEIVGDKPIQLAQYMVGANWLGIPRVCDEGADAFNPTGIGDPAMAIAVPIDQFRDHYIVHTPEDYTEDYLNVIVPIGHDVELDGEPVPASKWEIVGEMNRYEVATIEVEAGFHTLSAEVPFGVVGYGYDCHVSYAYPGGLDLEALDDEQP